VLSDIHEEMAMKVKPGSGRWFLLALTAGTVSGVICQVAGAPVILTQAIPFAVAAAIIHSTRKRWLE
jgi:hypothetical protein